MLKAVVSSLALGLGLASCSIANQNKMFRPVAQSAKEVRADQSASKLYGLAQQALQKGNFVQALAYSEQAVEMSPRDAGYRMLLGDLYLKNGRFLSAETAFSDVLILYPDNDRARFNLALAEIALGKQQPALEELDRLVATAAPADLGLAYALAGQPERALKMLEPAAREIGADGRVRQNLALTYALMGDWRRARVVAAQDLSPADLRARMEQWALFAQPKASHDQVASLLGVVAVEDAGQPVRLALKPEEPKSMEYADVGVEAGAGASPTAVSVEESSSTLAAAPAEVKVHYAEATQTGAATQSAASVPIPYNVPAAETKAISRYVVQLGVYRSANMVGVAWPIVRRRYSLEARVPVSGQLMLKKGVFYSLSVAGFARPRDAVRLCQSIKGKGGDCFARPASGETPVRFASRN